MKARARWISALLLLGFAPAASADPTLTPTPAEIELSPTMTVISFEVDPSGTPLSAVVLNFQAMASGLTMIAVTPTDPQIGGSGPALSGGEWTGGFVGAFATDRTTPFVVGTITLEGLVVDTPLVLSGNYTDGSFMDIPIPPTNIAVVVPEPRVLAVELAALGTLLGFRRWHARRGLRSRR